MKITLESTSTVVRVNGTEARVWEGMTEGGVPVVAFIVRTAVDEDHDSAEFERELIEKPPMRPAAEAWPLRMVI